VKYLPSWVPGAGFQRTALRFREQANALAEVPFTFVRQQMKQPGFAASYLSNLLQDKDIAPRSTDEVNIKWSAASLYGGGADTVCISNNLPGAPGAEY
jgi:hypothetical protein